MTRTGSGPRRGLEPRRRVLAERAGTGAARHAQAANLNGPTTGPARAGAVRWDFAETRRFLQEFMEAFAQWVDRFRPRR